MSEAEAVWAASLHAIRARWPALRDVMRAHRRLPLLWAPPVLSAREWKRIGDAVEGVYRALRVVDEVAGTGEGDGALFLPENARALAPAGDHARAGLQSCRLDALYDPDTGALAFVEVQAGDPSGMGLSDLVTSTLDAAGVISAVGAERPSLTRALLDVLGGHRADAGQGQGQGLVVVAATAQSSAIDADHELLVAEMQRLGLRARHAAPRSLRVERIDGAPRVTLDGENVGAILRDAPDDLDELDAAALAQALPHVHYMNPLRDARLDDKRCFVLLRDARVQARLDDDTRALVDRFVPETIELTTSSATDRALDRAEWVIKPALGFGGHGVTVGRDVDDAQWRAALLRASREPTVAQRCVPAAATPWPVLNGSDDDDVELELELDVLPRYTTWSFWVHGGRFSGAFVRAGEGAVVNVHQGGGIGPVLRGA